MKRITACAMALAAFAIALADEREGRVVADMVLARVDEAIITTSLLRGERTLLEIEEGASKLPDIEFLRRLIRRRLIVAEAGKLRLSATKEEIAALVEDLERKAGGEQALQNTLFSIGLSQEDIARRAEEKALAARFLALKRASVYVSESEVRSHIAQNPSADGEKPIAKVRDEVRELLASRKYQEELDKWIDRQIAQGRVRIIPVSD